MPTRIAKKQPKASYDAINDATAESPTAKHGVQMSNLRGRATTTHAQLPHCEGDDPSGASISTAPTVQSCKVTISTQSTHSAVQIYCKHSIVVSHSALYVIMYWGCAQRSRRVFRRLPRPARSTARNCSAFGYSHYQPLLRAYIKHRRHHQCRCGHASPLLVHVLLQIAAQQAARSTQQRSTQYTVHSSEVHSTQHTVHSTQHTAHCTQNMQHTFNCTAPHSKGA